MNNDLISRSKVMELIESKFVDGCLERGDETLIDGYGLLDEVSDLPTAYDVDKVVEQLEALSSGADDNIMKNEGSEQYYDGFGDGVDEAIKIVKAGGGK